MVMSAQLSEDDVRDLAAKVFGQLAEPWREPILFARAAPDFVGDDAVYITAVCPDGSRRLSGPEQIQLQMRIGDLLLERGDERLVYLSALTQSDFEELRLFEAEGPPNVA